MLNVSHYLLNVIMLNVVMLNVVLLNFFNAECHYAECHYAKCRCAECRGAQPNCQGDTFWSDKTNGFACRGCLVVSLSHIQIASCLDHGHKTFISVLFMHWSSKW